MKLRWKASGWFQGALFLSSAGLAIIILLLPMGLSAESWVMPDLVLALSFAWVIRRPDAVPFYLIGLVGLLADILLGKPMGQWALFLMLGAEFLRQQAQMIREYPFIVEMLWVAALFAVMLIAQRFLFFVALVPNLPANDALKYFFTTILFYPVVVAILHWVLGIRSRHHARTAHSFGQMT